MAGEKFIQHDAAGGLLEVIAKQVGGAGSENKIPSLDASGRLDATMMPTGIGAETSSLEAFGNLAAGDLVNVFSDGGVMKVRLADASSAVAPANGFVLSAFTTGQTALVYWGGLNSAITGATAGPNYLSTTPGKITTVAPSASGNIVQRIGWAITATNMFFTPREHILLA